MDYQQLQKIAKLIRYYILVSTTTAGSGHPTSSLSATDLMTVLLYGGFFRTDLKRPERPENDRIIFSKGHAAPLFYAMYAPSRAVSERELLSLRKFDSPLEGHPSMEFKYTEVPTGSLGQGLSVGVGMALNGKYADGLHYRTWVLLGDSEMSEGSQWEAIQIAKHYKLDNLIGILDVNRLGQRGETMYGHKVREYQKRIAAFGWQTYITDGHNLREIAQTYSSALRAKGRPAMIIARTLKGKGVTFIENKAGWHGKPLSVDELKWALGELGQVDIHARGVIAPPSTPSTRHPERSEGSPTNVGERASARDSSASASLQNDLNFSVTYPPDKPVATREAYGRALARIFPKFTNMVVLDAEVSNSTYSEIFRSAYPERFFEMFVAEQNMVGCALGFARRGKLPFVSTFAAFLSRAYDQIRMAQYAKAHIVFCGSHAGVSIGEDGPSQMGLEDLAMFRAILGSTVLYPCDAVSADKLVEQAAGYRGIVYIRTSRPKVPIIYRAEEEFPIGGSKILRQSKKDEVTVIGAGVTVPEALAAHDELKKQGIAIRVIDLYSVKPIDAATIRKAAQDTRAIITVEDHFAEGGIGEAVVSALAQRIPPLKSDASVGLRPRRASEVRGGQEGLCTPIHTLAVRKMPKSAAARELLDYEEISKNAIVKAVQQYATPES